MKAPLLFAALIMSVAVSAVYSLTLLDNIVHDTLYDYGLRFSYDWATPYWTILRTIQALMGLSAVFALTFTIYVYRKCVYAKPQIEPIVREEQVSVSTTEPQIEPNVRVVSSGTEPQQRSVSGLVKCAHCGKTFPQPLRRLDFSSDKPRIVNVCPTCNEEIKPIISRGELERVEKAVQKKKKKRKAKVVRESQEALQEQPKDETKETVTVQAC